MGEAPVWAESIDSIPVPRMAGIGAERKHMILPTNFCSSPKTGHSRYCDWTARFCAGFRMPALPVAYRRALGPASESLQGRNPRWAAMVWPSMAIWRSEGLRARYLRRRMRVLTADCRGRSEAAAVCGEAISAWYCALRERLSAMW